MMRQRVTVYYFKAWDPQAGEHTPSKRPGTREAIARARGEVMLETAQEVDEADVDGDGFLREEALMTTMRFDMTPSAAAVMRVLAEPYMEFVARLLRDGRISQAEFDALGDAIRERGERLGELVQERLHADSQQG